MVAVDRLTLLYVRAGLKVCINERLSSRRNSLADANEPMN